MNIIGERKCRRGFNITSFPPLHFPLKMSIITQEITETCFNWCKEQNFIHQSNVQINDLAFIVIALISLTINNLIYNHPETLKQLSGMNDYQLEKAFDATYFLTFIMLITYIIYMVFFK